MPAGRLGLALRSIMVASLFLSAHGPAAVLRARDELDVAEVTSYFEVTSFY